MEKAYAKAAVKYMNDEEIQKFVSIPLQKYEGFLAPMDNPQLVQEMVSFIEFKNKDGRNVSVTIKMYENIAIGFEAKEWESKFYPYRNRYITKEITHDIGSSNLWFRPNYQVIREHNWKKFLISRAFYLYDIILNGCIEVLKEFDKNNDYPFLIMQGYLDDNGNFKTKLSLHF